MGAFYDSIHIRTDDFLKVQHTLKNTCCFISPPINGWTTVFLRDDNYPLCEELSMQFDSLVIVIKLHDDDIFYYTCYWKGALIDSYDSAPGCFSDKMISEEERVMDSGKPETWVGLLPFGIDPQKIHDILSSMRTANMFLGDYPEQFCGILHLPNALMAYQYLRKDNPEMLADVLQLNAFVHCCPCPETLGSVPNHETGIEYR